MIARPQHPGVAAAAAPMLRETEQYCVCLEEFSAACRACARQSEQLASYSSHLTPQEALRQQATSDYDALELASWWEELLDQRKEISAALMGERSARRAAEPVHSVERYKCTHASGMLLERMHSQLRYAHNALQELQATSAQPRMDVLSRLVRSAAGTAVTSTTGLQITSHRSRNQHHSAPPRSTDTLALDRKAALQRRRQLQRPAQPQRQRRQRGRSPSKERLAAEQSGTPVQPAGHSTHAHMAEPLPAAQVPVATPLRALNWQDTAAPLAAAAATAASTAARAERTEHPKQGQRRHKYQQQEAV
eukprot:SAG25_NODE_3285_length_1145_cov_1.608987_1_plen_305_part_01